MLKCNLAALAFAILAAVLAAKEPSPEPAPDGSDIKNDAKKIQGSWELASASGGSKPTVKNTKIRMEVKGNQLVIKDGNRDEKATFKLDGKAKIKRIDLSPAGPRGGGQKALGIYTLEKDRLTICFHTGGKTRPSGFNDPTALTLVFKRVAAKK